ncbi:amidase [Mesorhizobium ciceri]|nr:MULTISPECIES: amidase [Mesorhizobium]AMX99602.1 amidase [Mesorhizobium ciceri biovar biserrulae]MDF3218249.1 amidase [Mesorhizobium ciceri]RUY65349.1 amidase [Mesorhizobium sp. M7A.F.Ca.CA.001.13.1.1]RUY99745.1 amidase [Mesorhizobium sp. M7A.F.Ca.CA.001.04.2.1]RUZ25722.1 amidase [Mesorhizobium sp. M7A.F.Ca.CA.001.04.1.1]
MLLRNDPVGAFVDYPPIPIASAASGPLAGLTLAVKDLYDVAGYPTGGGHPLRREWSGGKPDTAPVVQTLLDAGARFIGKTHTDEFAYSMNGENPHYGTPVNPRAPGRIPGGSSSGSVAAVAAGLADIALGTDTGGSIRLPASYCGLIGLRPTHGRIDTVGLQPLARSFDTVGWFARDVGVYEAVARLLLPEDTIPPPITRLVVATDIASYVLGHLERRVFEDVLERLFRIIDIAGEVRVAPDGFDAWRPIFRAIQAYEAWADHGAWITEHRPVLGEGVRQRFDWAERVPISDYETALAGKAVVREHLSSLAGSGTALVFPTAPSVALPLGMAGEALEAYRSRSISMLCTAGLSGLPQISMPIAEVEGLPFGISILGPRNSEMALLALCRRALQQYPDRG